MQRPVKHKETFHYLEAVRTAVIFSHCWVLARNLIALSFEVRYFRGRVSSFDQSESGKLKALVSRF